jgi:hypothetical protein
MSLNNNIADLRNMKHNEFFNVLEKIDEPVAGSRNFFYKLVPEPHTNLPAPQ